MDQYNINELPSEQLVFLVASTFGSGGAPENGEVCFFRVEWQEGKTYPVKQATNVNTCSI